MSSYLALLLVTCSLILHISAAVSSPRDTSHAIFEHPRAAFALQNLHVELQNLPPILFTTDHPEGWVGGAVTVSWSGVLFPRPDDLVALYVPADADPRLRVPVQYVNATAAASGTHLQSGEGSVK